MTGMGRGKRGSYRRCAAVLAFCAIAGCWESALPAGFGDDTLDGDGGAESTDPLVGWSCSDLSPCVQSDVSGFTCPGFASNVQCWNLGLQCDAVYLCASAAQACEIGCAATACGATTSSPPTPVCQ